MGGNGSKPNDESVGGSVLRPGAEWMQDRNFEACYHCQKKFSITVRRHHCRMCGAVYCSNCCPRSKDCHPPIHTRVSYPAEQRQLERLCRSCRLPMWLLPMSVLRTNGHLRTVLEQDRLNGKAKVNPKSKDSNAKAIAWLERYTELDIDGTVMKTILAFSDNAMRNALLQTHPSIRHCLPIPDIVVTFPNNDTPPVVLPVPLVQSVAAVYPGVVAIGDGAYSGGFRKGMHGFAFGLQPTAAPQPRDRRQASANPPPERPNPSRVGVAHVGTGGQGSVYYALDRQRRCYVVVKLVAKSFEESSFHFRYEKTFRIIEREIATHFRLTNSPNVAALHAVFQTRGHVVMVVNAGEGRTARTAALEVRKHDESHRSPTRMADIVPLTLRVIRDVAGALQGMKERGYVHRDIKLDNMIMSRDYREVRLIDFGLSEPFNDRDEYAPLGTPSYLSPENTRAVVQGQKRYGARPEEIVAADVFSLGVAATAMLTAQRVYPVPNDYKQMLASIRAGYRCTGPGWEDVPPDVRSLVESMLAYEASRRPTPAELVQHPVMVDGPMQQAMNDLCRRRFQRVQTEDHDIVRTWDMLLDCDDPDSEDDEATSSKRFSKNHSAIIDEPPQLPSSPASNERVTSSSSGGATAAPTANSATNGSLQGSKATEDCTAPKPRPPGSGEPNNSGNAVVIGAFEDEGDEASTAPGVTDADRAAARNWYRSQHLETIAVPLKAEP